MKVAIIGPVCWDTNTLNGISEVKPGGVTYYAGNALAALNVDTAVLGSFGNAPFDGHFRCPLIYLQTDETVEFRNVYVNGARHQEAKGANIIHYEDVRQRLENDLDYILLGPLLHDNISAESIRRLAKHAPLMLAVQGMIRHAENGIVAMKSGKEVVEALPYIDCIFMDYEEMRIITETDVVEYGMAMLHDYGARNIVVTLACKGALLSDGKMIYVPALRSEKIEDATGAGDIFMATYALACSLYASIKERGHFASIATTLFLEKPRDFKVDLDSILAAIHFHGA